MAISIHSKKASGKSFKISEIFGNLRKMRPVETTGPTYPATYRFGQFVVNEKKRVLIRDGLEVHLTAKVMDILLVFLANPGRVLDKDELIEKV